MQYKSLNQSQIKIISTIDTTINISNDLTELDWGKFSGPAAIVVSGSDTPTASTQYVSTGSTLTPYSLISSYYDDITITLFSVAKVVSNQIDDLFLGESQNNISVNNVVYYGYKSVLYRGAVIYGEKNSIRQYVMPKGVLKVILYDNTAKTIITKEWNFNGIKKSLDSELNNNYYYSVSVSITKGRDDLILGTFFEAEPITVTKNLTGCTATDNTTNNQYNFGQPYTIEVKPTTGHTLTGSIISFTADGVAIPTAAYTWDETDGICTINPIYVSNQLVVNVQCPEN